MLQLRIQRNTRSPPRVHRRRRRWGGRRGSWSRRGGYGRERRRCFFCLGHLEQLGHYSFLIRAWGNEHRVSPLFVGSELALDSRGQGEWPRKREYHDHASIVQLWTRFRARQPSFCSHLSSGKTRDVTFLVTRGVTPESFLRLAAAVMVSWPVSDALFHFHSSSFSRTT
jgi:hypothetical protein